MTAILDGAYSWPRLTFFVYLLDVCHGGRRSDYNQIHIFVLSEIFFITHIPNTVAQPMLVLDGSEIWDIIQLFFL